METLTQNSLVIYLDNNQVEPETKTTLLQSFETFFTQAQEWKDKAEGLVITSIDQKEEIKQAKEARLALKSIRVNTEHKRKALKEESLRKGQTIDAIAKIITNEILPIEEHLEKQEKFAEIQEARIKAELKESRLAELAAYSVDGAFYDLANMPDESYNQFLENSKIAHKAKLQAAIEAEEERLEREIADAEERAERLRIEAEERAEMEAENKRLKEEAEARELEAARLKTIRSERNEELRPYINFIRDYTGMIELEESAYQKELSDIKIGAEQQYEYERKQRQKQREEQEAAEQKLISERKERERLEFELKAKQEAEENRLREIQEREETELSKGDKAKFQSLITDIEILKGKYSFKSKKYKTLQNNINELLNKTIIYAQSKI